MRIETISERHLEPVAELGAANLTELRRMLPLLPERWTQPHTLAEYLARAVAEGRGVVALDGGTVIGYMAYAQFAFKGLRAAMAPEYGHATIQQGSRRINEAMYTALADRWAREGRSLHLIAWTPNDAVAEQTWLWQGFGLLCVDALRDLAPIENVDTQAIIRPAMLNDVTACHALGARLSAHLHASPTLLGFHADDESAWRETLSDEGRHIALAVLEGEPVGYLKIGPANEDACTIIEDADTASISGAYVAPEHRGKGIAPALLDDCLRWARERGYCRCAVDFESANCAGARFWMRHFAPVSLGAMRYVEVGEH